MLTPALFISHGSPELAVKDSPAHRFLAGYAAHLRRPERILVVSAHWETEQPTVATAFRPETVYDFGRFDRRLFEIRYAAPGDPALSLEAAALLKDAGILASADPAHGWDHGVWVPLHLLYPDAGIPVAQLSIQPAKGPAHHYRLGQALAPLRERNVLIIASGAMTHNLREYFSVSESGETPGWVTAFTDWMCDGLERGLRQDVLEYRQRAPDAIRNHPEDEHLLPLFVALGATSESEPIRRVHHSLDRVIAMDVYRFGN